jgi:hypothetical protein
MDKRAVRVGIGVVGVVDIGFRLFEVVVLDATAIIAERIGKRMTVMEIEATAGSNQLINLFGPAIDAGQPAKGAETYVDDVEGLLIKGADGVIHVGTDESRNLRQPSTFGEITSGSYGRG